MSVADSRRSPLDWRKSQRSMGNGECVEVGTVGRGVAVRDSMDPEGSWLTYGAQPWQTFVTEIKNQ